ncbi:anti-sigma factor [Blastococcus sp. LR1]|uniref:anti-sigma factor n=1 Tax=Blastococcus sp. LR1 TaxID=2877000 RepID=UPI001CCB0D78|nr:anti-sigma factor [Blastococcus sp. LR1]MCA0145025.1 anti-sigma factor [Blastococcus sp. LR1]
MVQHCLPEQLALAALREPLPDDDAFHLAACDLCRAEVASLRRAVEAVSVPELADPGPSVTPPPAVWGAIAAATGVTAAPAGMTAPVAAAPSAAAPSVGPSSEETPGGAQVLPFRTRRRGLVLVAAAAVAGAVLGAGVTAVVRSGESTEALTAVALDPLDDEQASGRAEVLVREDGSRALQVDLDAPALDGEYYELWLIEPQVVDMVPLGVLRPGSQTFELPAGLDLGEYPLVDVSVEPLDGDPTHSGISVARGELDT